jgi:hypothetical protein
MISKKQLMAMSLSQRFHFLTFNTNYPCRDLLLRNVEIQIKKNVWLKREDRNGKCNDDEMFGGGVRSDLPHMLM